MSLVLSTYESETFTRCPRGMVLDVFKCACKASESARLIDERLVQLLLLEFRKPLFLGSNLANCCTAVGHLAREAHWVAKFANLGIVAVIIKFVEETLHCSKRENWWDRLGFGSVRGQCPCAVFVGSVRGKCPWEVSVGSVKCTWEVYVGSVRGKCPWEVSVGSVRGKCPCDDTAHDEDRLRRHI